MADPTPVLRRRLDILDSPIIHCALRVTRQFPEAFYDFVVSHLDLPEPPAPDTVAHLAAHLAAQPGYDDDARRAGIDSAALFAALEPLTFAEALALVDAAEVRRAERRRL